MLVAHLAWILWVIFGALWTKNRPLLAGFHIASLVWGIVVELGPWPCPLTLAEEFFERGSGADMYRAGFLVHFLDSVIYPEISVQLLTICGVAVCGVNLAIYARRYWRVGKDIT